MYTHTHTHTHTHITQDNPASRAASRIRESPHYQDSPVSPPNPGVSSPPPSKPPRTLHQPSTNSRLDHPPPLPPTDSRFDHPPPLPIEPYSVTTISASSGNTRIPNSRSSESPMPSGMNSIPPPPIIRKQLDSTNSGDNIYYSTPAEMLELSSRGASRVLNEEGVFVDRDTHTSHSSLDSNRDQGVRPRLGEGMSVCPPASEY